MSFRFLWICKINDNCIYLFTDCPTAINDMLTVTYPFEQPQYNSRGEFVCYNGGALFSNNMSVSTETVCNETAQWNIPKTPQCYTGIWAS